MAIPRGRCSSCSVANILTSPSYKRMIKMRRKGKGGAEERREGEVGGRKRRGEEREREMRKRRGFIPTGDKQALISSGTTPSPFRCVFITIQH